LAKSETGKGTETGTEADTEGTPAAERKKRKAKPTPAPSASANEGATSAEGDLELGGRMTLDDFNSLDKKQLKTIAKNAGIKLSKDEGKGEKTVDELRKALTDAGVVRIKKSKK
jgi:IMP dehydrogenase/GMP reductase